MAGGEQKRYAPSTPKQFIRVDGERIIERAIRLFSPIGQPWVIAGDPAFAYLVQHGAQIAPPSETSHELSKFMSSHALWKDDEEVLFLYGDCYFADDCARRIISERPDEDFTFFGIWGEMLALWLHAGIYEKFIRAVAYIKELQSRGEGGLCGSWTLYRLLLGKDLLLHRFYDHFVRIHDESTDFDAESCLETWLRKYPQHTGSVT